MVAAGAGFTLCSVEEYASDAEFAACYLRTERSASWPMLVARDLRADDDHATHRR